MWRTAADRPCLAACVGSYPSGQQSCHPSSDWLSRQAGPKAGICKTSALAQQCACLSPHLPTPAPQHPSHHTQPRHITCLEVLQHALERDPFVPPSRHNLEHVGHSLHCLRTRARQLLLHQQQQQTRRVHMLTESIHLYPQERLHHLALTLHLHCKQKECPQTQTTCPTQSQTYPAQTSAAHPFASPRKELAQVYSQAPTSQCGFKWLSTRCGSVMKSSLRRGGPARTSSTEPATWARGS